MPVKRLNPYIHLNGTAEQAIRLYESALGAEAQHIMRFSDAPGMDMPAEQKNRILHAQLSVGDSVLMVSDGCGESSASGGNVQILLDFSGVEEMTKAFDALAAEGSVTCALHDAFWGAKFGTLTDQHGVRWLFHCELKKPEA